jgi:hypothetical protein
VRSSGIMTPTTFSITGSQSLQLPDAMESKE